MTVILSAGAGRPLASTLARVVVGLSLLALWHAGPSAFAQESAQSQTCGPVSGKSKDDLAHVLSFCKKGIPTGVTSGAYAMESLLWIKVPKATADAFLTDRLGFEQLVKVWMKGWKQETDRKAVTVYVEWGDVEIARGETTLRGDEKVTIKR